MMDIVQIDLGLPSLLLPFVIVCIGQFVDSIISRGKREKITSYQRELYYQKLSEESHKMEEKALKEELQLAKNVENLLLDNEELKNQLDEDVLDDSDWSNEETGDRKVEELKKELEILDGEFKELESIEADISNISKDIQPEVLNEPLELVERIKQLESENESLKCQLATHDSLPQLITSHRDLDPNLLKYLEDHRDELTLSFLEKAHETLLELKASNPEKSFDDYIDELKNCQSLYVTELTNLRLSKKEVEIKLQLMRARYEEELSSFNEIRIEHLFKNSGAKEFLERLKEKNRIKDDIISSLKRELESKKNEVMVWEQKFRESDEQCSAYWKAWKDTQVKKEQLEAEKRQVMNLSSASSFIENQVPPPPPIDIPSVDEILRSSSSHQLMHI